MYVYDLEDYAACYISYVTYFLIIMKSTMLWLIEKITSTVDTSSFLLRVTPPLIIVISS